MMMLEGAGGGGGVAPGGKRETYMQSLIHSCLESCTVLGLVSPFSFRKNHMLRQMTSSTQTGSIAYDECMSVGSITHLSVAHRVRDRRTNPFVPVRGSPSGLLFDSLFPLVPEDLKWCTLLSSVARMMKRSGSSRPIVYVTPSFMETVQRIDD